MSETNSPDLPANTPAEGAEQPAENAAPEQPRETKSEHQDWREKRLANITRQKALAEENTRVATERARQLEAELERYRAAQPEGERQQRAPDPRQIEQQAEQRVAERMRQEREAADFTEACNQAASKIKAEFGDAGLSVAATGWTNAGLDLSQAKHRELLSLITSIDDGHKIYHSVGTDPNLAAHLLELSPVRAAFEIAKLLPAKQAQELRQEAVAAAETALAPAATPAPATLRPAPTTSSAPRPPSQPVATRSGSSGSADLSKMSMAEYAETRRKQMAGASS